MKLIFLCAALAAGEFLASLAPQFADCWPALLGLLAPVALFGYGLGLRRWPLLACLVLGAALFFRASVADERLYRERPWMRGRARRAAPSAQSPLLRAAKRDLSRRIARGLDETCGTAALSRAILLGERRRLPPETKRLFVESGALHVFAISGLHVMAIADVLTGLLALLLVPRRFAGLAAVPLLWGYVALIGFPPSAVRAAAMATFSCLAPACWRRPDALRAWALAFLAVHLAAPRMVTDVGNALSFAVMLALVLTGRLCARAPRLARELAATAAAWAAGVPIAAHVFGRVTPGGMLANLLLLAAARFTVVTGAAAVLAGYLSETVAAHFANLSSLGVRAMVFVAEGVSRLPGANFDTGEWPLAGCAAWTAGLVALGWAIHRRANARNVL